MTSLIIWKWHLWRCRKAPVSHAKLNKAVMKPSSRKSPLSQKTKLESNTSWTIPAQPKQPKQQQQQKKNLIQQRSFILIIISCFQGICGYKIMSYKSTCTLKTISKATQHLQQKGQRLYRQAKNTPLPYRGGMQIEHPEGAYPFTNGLQTYSVDQH